MTHTDEIKAALEALLTFDGKTFSAQRDAISAFGALVYPHQETIRAALQAAQGPQWQPIETAPKDGTRMLICDERYSYVGWYDDRLSFPWQFIDLDGDRNGMQSAYPPLGWTPLPQPPEA